MWLSYEESQLDEETLALADEISDLIVGANVTYGRYILGKQANGIVLG